MAGQASARYIQAMSGAKKASVRSASGSVGAARRPRRSPPPRDEAVPDAVPDMSVAAFARVIEAGFQEAAEAAVRDTLHAGVPVYGSDDQGRLIEMAPDGTRRVLTKQQARKIAGLTAD